MDSVTDPLPPSEPLGAKLSGADDRICLSHWLPPQAGIVPLIRLRTRWYGVRWALPIAFALLVATVALAQALRQLPGVQAFSTAAGCRFDDGRRVKLGAALYAGWGAFVITGIVGGLGFAFQQPWLFPSLGPTIFIHTVTPD